MPWGVLRVEGLGSGSPTPELDITASMVAATDGCVLIAVLHLDIGEVAVTITRAGAPDGFVPMYSGRLATPRRVLEVADVVGDDFSYRYAVSSQQTTVTILADVPDEAAHLCIVVPDVLARTA